EVEFEIGKCGSSFQLWMVAMHQYHLHDGIDKINGCEIFPVVRIEEKNKSRMETHNMITHQQKLDYEIRDKCDQCEFACFTKHEFKRHTLNHLGEKPFKCTECDFATVEKMNLKFHMRTHTGEKPYECPICHRKFPRTLGLRRHMLVHSGQKPHKCSECSMAYADKRSLESHQYSTHLQIKPFLCPHCTYACIRRENLNRHIKRCH
ncbi:hypothetical protein CAPTEDRAFT_41560, partial [Capitella teleta]